MATIFGQWTPLVWFFIGFALVFLLTRWINAHLQGMLLLLGMDEDAIMYLQFVLLFPGILLHEVNHWIAAKLLGVRTLGFSVWPQKKGGGKFQYGSVRIASADIVRSSLIGLAPFVGASLVLILIGRYALGAESLRQVIALGQWNFLWGTLAEATKSPDFWVWLYLIFAVSNAMFPSAADRESWKPLLVYLTIAGVLLYLAGWKPSLQGVPSFLEQVTNPLVYAFGITAIADLFFAVVIGVLEIALGAIRGRRVQY